MWRMLLRLVLVYAVSLLFTLCLTTANDVGRNAGICKVRI